MKNTKTTAACLIAAAAFSVAVQEADAASVLIGPAPPAVNGADIANLAQVNLLDNFGSSILWGDRPARGQTFTTGSDGPYTLTAITVQAANGSTANGTYGIRVGSISGTNISVIASESVSTNDDVATNSFLTFVLDTPVVLAANTLYGFDVVRSSGSGWKLLNNTDQYADGRRYSSGNRGEAAATIGYHGATEDRIFHLDITGPVIPTPSAALAGVVALGGLALRRRRNG